MREDAFFEQREREREALFVLAIEKRALCPHRIITEALFIFQFAARVPEKKRTQRARLKKRKKKKVTQKKVPFVRVPRGSGKRSFRRRSKADLRREKHLASKDIFILPQNLSQLSRANEQSRGNTRGKGAHIDTVPKNDDSDDFFIGE